MDDLLRQARALRQKAAFREALPLYLKVLEQNPSHLEALTGAAYLYGEVGKQGEARKEYFRKSVELAERAYRLDPESPDSNLAMAWALGGVALISGANGRVRAAKRLKEHLDVVLKKRPREPLALYILANWNYEIATAGFFERAAAKLLFGGLPEGVTIEAALQAYRQVVGLKPDRILYRFEFARALSKDGQRQEALEQLKTLVESPPVFEGDEKMVAEAQSMIRKLEK